MVGVLPQAAFPTLCKNSSCSSGSFTPQGSHEMLERSSWFSASSYHQEQELCHVLQMCVPLPAFEGFWILNYCKPDFIELEASEDIA